MFATSDGANNPAKMAESFGVPYLGSIPLDSNLVVLLLLLAWAVVKWYF